MPDDPRVAFERIDPVLATACLTRQRSSASQVAARDDRTGGSPCPPINDEADALPERGFQAHASLSLRYGNSRQGAGHETAALRRRLTAAPTASAPSAIKP